MYVNASFLFRTGLRSQRTTSDPTEQPRGLILNTQNKDDQKTRRVEKRQERKKGKECDDDSYAHVRRREGGRWGLIEARRHDGIEWTYLDTGCVQLHTYKKRKNRRNSKKIQLRQLWLWLETLEMRWNGVG